MNRTGNAIAALGLALALCAAAPAARAQDGAPGRIRIENVEVRLSPVGHVVLLKVGNRAIPVFVDAVVAESIQTVLTGKRTPRPLTHELVRAVLDAFDGRVTQAVVTLKGQTFHAALTVVLRMESRVFDSRSSDAIALAIHFNAPILVGQDLLDAQGVDLDKPESKPAPKQETRT